MQKDLGPIADEHTDILDALRSKDAKRVAALMREHIVDYTRALDHEGFIERLRVSGEVDEELGVSATACRAGWP